MLYFSSLNMVAILDCDSHSQAGSTNFITQFKIGIIAYIFIQYFCFLLEISSVICWTQNKRGEMERTVIEKKASSKTTKSDITLHNCNQCSLSSVGKILLKNTLRYTVERNRRNVTSAIFQQLKQGILKDTLEITLARSPTMQFLNF